MQLAAKVLGQVSAFPVQNSIMSTPLGLEHHQPYIRYVLLLQTVTSGGEVSTISGHAVEKIPMLLESSTIAQFPVILHLSRSFFCCRRLSMMPTTAPDFRCEKPISYHDNEAAHASPFSEEWNQRRVGCSKTPGD